MDHLSSFPPISTPEARVLILGSMPSEASLRAGQYYGHPRNAFWWIMGELLGAGRELPYSERCEILERRGLAVWDSLRSCVRPGSLDSDIDRASEVANDFRAFFSVHRAVERIGFNGRKAEHAFLRGKEHHFAGMTSAPDLFLLPSTSPAMAALRPEQKLERWRAFLAPLLAGSP